MKIKKYKLRIPLVKNFIHWAVVNIPSSARELKEGASRVQDTESLNFILYIFEYILTVY